MLLYGGTYEGFSSGLVQYAGVRRQITCADPRDGVRTIDHWSVKLLVTRYSRTTYSTVRSNEQVVGGDGAVTAGRSTDEVDVDVDGLAGLA